ncbi:hypothetical protein LCGC14_1774080 [marine sediment metagenome]|uniref:Uncharacterized protein n=1 Tax=marine sediment metagenome TaxID=412755 RepID=A0A0F9GXH6_9ZZZZ
MTLQKAVEILRNFTKTEDKHTDPDLTDAMKLGASSLERTLRLRSSAFPNVQPRLPGETL